MFLDNIIIFLNVLEQFAIRVTIFDIDIEDIIKYVNKLYFNNNDELIQNLVKKSSNIEHFDPKVLIKQSLNEMDKKITNNFNKLDYVYPSTNQTFRFIY